MFLLLLGVLASLVLSRLFPPPALTRSLGIAAWLFGSLMLLNSEQESWVSA
jgi:hypothetical protein